MGNGQCRGFHDGWIRTLTRSRCVVGLEDLGSEPAASLTEMLQAASVVFAMTAAHAEAASILRMLEGPAIQPDPAGDVPDPSGMVLGCTQTWPIVWTLFLIK